MKVVESLNRLKHLRTLHVRNLPPLENTEHLSPLVSDDERSEVFVTTLVRAMVKWRWDLPSLETIALGILRTQDVCGGKSSLHADERLDEFLKLRVYHVEYRRNFQGDRIPVVTLVAKGTTDSIQDICHNITILQSNWMS